MGSSCRVLNIISTAQPTLFLMSLGDKIQQFSLQIRREDRALKIKTIREGLVESILIRQSSGCPFCGTSIVINLLQCFRTQHVCSCHLPFLACKTAEVLQLEPHLIRQYFRTHSNSSVLQRCLVLFITIIEKGFFDQYPLQVRCLTEQSLLRDAMSIGFSLKELEEDDYSLVEISLLKELAKQACILFVSRHPFLYLQIAEQYPFQCLVHHIRCKSTQLGLMDILTPLSFQTGNHEVLREIFSWVQTEVSLSKSEKEVSRVVSLFLLFVEYGSPEILGIEGIMCASILAYGVKGHAFSKLKSIVESREWPLNRENQERIMEFIDNHDGFNCMMAEQNWRI